MVEDYSIDRSVLGILVICHAQVIEGGTNWLFEASMVLFKQSYAKCRIYSLKMPCSGFPLIDVGWLLGVSHVRLFW